MYLPTILLQNLKEMEVEMKRLEELYKGIQGLQSLAEKMNDCNHELQWAYVNEIEKVMTGYGIFMLGQVQVKKAFSHQ